MKILGLKICRDCKTEKAVMYGWIAKVFSKRMQKWYRYQRWICKECSAKHVKEWMHTPKGRKLKAKLRKRYKEKKKLSKAN